MKYRVDGVSVTVVEDEIITSGSVNVYRAKFEFDPSWDGFTKFAVFKRGYAVMEQELINDECTIPWETLQIEIVGDLHVGVRGLTEDAVRPTCWAVPKTIQMGVLPGDKSKKPTPDIYQQLLADIKNAKTLYLNLVEVDNGIDPYGFKIVGATVDEIVKYVEGGGTVALKDGYNYLPLVYIGKEGDHTIVRFAQRDDSGSYIGCTVWELHSNDEYAACYNVTYDPSRTGFITKNVSDLDNYYNKDEIDTKIKNSGKLDEEVLTEAIETAFEEKAGELYTTDDCGNMFPFDDVKEIYRANGVTITHKDGVFTLNGTSTAAYSFEITPNGTGYATLKNGVTYKRAMRVLGGEASMADGSSATWYAYLFLKTNKNSVPMTYPVDAGYDYVAVDENLNRFAINIPLAGVTYKDYKLAPYFGLATDYKTSYNGTHKKIVVPIGEGFGMLNHGSAIPNWDTTNKTFTIPSYSRILTASGKHTKGMTDGANIVLSLTYERGIVCYNTSTGAFAVYSHDSADGSVPKTSLLIASYAQYGAIVHMAGSYTINGNLFGIGIPDTPESTDTETTAQWGYIYNTQFVPNLDTVKATFTIPGNSSVFSTTTRYALSGSNIVVDLSALSDKSVIIYYDTATQAINRVMYYGISTIPKTALILAMIGRGPTNGIPTVWMNGNYTINGNLYGIAIPNAEQSPYPIRHPKYTYWDMSDAVNNVNVGGWSDITFINGKLWAFNMSKDETHDDASGTIKIIDISTTPMVVEKTITHNFGHVNTVDYCAETDCLIVGNLPGNDEYPAALYIFYNVSAWANDGVTSLDFNTVDKTIIDLRSAWAGCHAATCAWGENNFASNNIVYVTTNYDSRVAKIMLGMGTNQFAFGSYVEAPDNRFNGTYKVLKESSFSILKDDAGNPSGLEEVVQGATFHEGRLLTANGDAKIPRASIWHFDSVGKINRELIEFPSYHGDGELDANPCYAEGIAVDDNGYVYQGLYSAQLHAGKRFYLIKYKL